MSQELKGFCPNCAWEIYYDPAKLPVHCNCCDCEVTPAASPAAKAPAATAAAMPVVTSFDSAESALVYLENFFDNYDWEDYGQRTAVIIPDIERMVATTKAQSGASAFVWQLDFKSVAVPMSKKLQALAAREADIVSKFDPEDSTEALIAFTAMRKINNALLREKDALLKRLDNAVAYAARLGLKEDALAAMKNELAALKKALTKQLRELAELRDMPAYAKAEADAKEAKRAAILEEKGIDAEEVYQSAVSAYDENAVDNNEALAMFESIRGYADSADYIKRINRYFNFHSELFHFVGKSFIFRRRAVETPAMDPKNPAATPAPEESAAAAVPTLNLYEIVDGEVSKRPAVEGIDQIITCYGSRLYFFKAKGLFYFDFATMAETCIDKGVPADYRTGKRGYRITVARQGNAFFFLKRLPVHHVGEAQKVGCLDKIKALFGKKVEEPENPVNNFTVLSVDMKTGELSTLIPQMVDIADHYEDSLFYTFAESIKEKTSEGTKVEIKTKLMLCNTLTGECSCILDEGCEIHNVVDGKVIYTVWKPNEFNRALCVLNLADGETTVIEENVLGYFFATKTHVYYKVGDSTRCPLMRNTYAADDRQEIMSDLESVLFVRGNWMYVKKGVGRNSTIVKVRCDGAVRIPLCNGFKRSVRFDDESLYYLDVNNRLCFVRSDGSEAKVIVSGITFGNGWSLDSSLIIGENSIYYLHDDQYAGVDMRSAGSTRALYRIDLEGNNVKKLLYGIDKMQAFDEDSFYYSKLEDMRFKVTVPAAKEKDVVTYYETHRLTKFFRYSQTTGESELILTLGLPHGNTTYKAGCLKKEKTADLIYEEAPVVKSFKRLGLAGVGETTAVAEAAAAAAAESTPVTAANGCAGVKQGCAGIFAKFKK